MIDRAIRLERLPAGKTARICRIEGRLDHVHRFEELGFSTGTRIQMFRPGNPCIIRLAGGKVCIRSDGSLRVLVEPDLAAG
jgi:Fe2+ transport system protein FeoA